MSTEGMRRAGNSSAKGITLTTSVAPPDGRKYWLEESMLRHGRQNQVVPTFTIASASEVFFGRSPDWLRGICQKAEKGEDVLMLDEKVFTPPRADNGSRTFSLVDIERLAHALAENRKIDGDRFNATINIILLVAYQHAILRERAFKYRVEIPGQTALDIGDAG